jgi:putative hydrolase of the HAD superfamily
VKIQAILFDLGKVLVDFDIETGVNTLHAASAVSRSRFEEVLWSHNWVRRYELGEISTRDFHAYLCESAGLKMDLPGFCAVWSSVFLPEPIVSEGLLLALRQKYPLILVSNTNEAHLDYIRSNYRVLDFFDHHVLSYEVGSLKPDRKIFEHAIALSGHPAEALFFTDDREENVLAASQMGMHTHRFTNAARLLRAFRDAGIEIADFALDRRDSQ